MDILIAFLICIGFINILCWVFKEDPATKNKTPAAITPLQGDLCTKLCPRQEIYKIWGIESEGMWLMPFCVDGRVICPPKWGTEPKNLVWVTTEEFNKHFTINHNGK